MTVLSISERISRMKKKAGVPYVGFEVLRVSKSPAKVLDKMAANVVSIMNPENTEDAPFNPLGVEVYTSENGNYIADVLMRCGGPNIRVRYESRKGIAVIYYKWERDYLDVEIDGAPIIDLIEQIAEG